MRKINRAFIGKVSFYIVMAAFLSPIAAFGSLSGTAGPSEMAVSDTSDDSINGYTIAQEGAWCWFADPRALHYENANGSINSTYIGYIDIHGHIKATQHDFLTGRTDEVSIRTCFQPDDHNNPTFLVLPDERIMVFYSRHTDEACFYYRISQKPGDITTLGKEIRLATANNTTYPSPFILSDDPEHIYLCWRGINWHPTIGQLSLPDGNDECRFTWGPYQMVKSTGARPYAKYASNGKDRIQMAYTTAHPDNQYPNYIYFNYIDINSKQLKDVDGEFLSNIADGAFSVAANNHYTAAHPATVVDDTEARNWIWQTTLDEKGHPRIAMVRISPDKKSHDYYYAQWTGQAWKKTFLCHAGGHFHQTPTTEKCYSGGMSIDEDHPDDIYCSVPRKNHRGDMVYEILRYHLDPSGEIIDSTIITRDSDKNNIRPYMISASGKSPMRLLWMSGDYYYWIVSSVYPKAFPTTIQSLWQLPPTTLPEKSKTFIVSLSDIPPNGEICHDTRFTYAIDTLTHTPYMVIDGKRYDSNNVLGSSDTWQNLNNGTDGKWPKVSLFNSFELRLSVTEGALRSYINGSIDQSIVLPKGMKLKKIKQNHHSK